MKLTIVNIVLIIIIIIIIIIIFIMRNIIIKKINEYGPIKTNYNVIVYS
jgi:hypothetical protein